MRVPLENAILVAVAEALSGYYRLVLVVGPGRSGKTKALKAAAERLGAPLLNINLLLSEALIDLPRRQRALGVSDVLAKVLDQRDNSVVAVDNIEILFESALRQDPLRLIQSLARNRTVIASWAGRCSGSDLLYAEPGHPEYRRYTRPDAVLISTLAGYGIG